jgi:hypothetical protein
MAASAAGRELRYFTFGDRGLADSFQEVYDVLVEKKVTVGELFRLLLKISKPFNVIEEEPEDPSQEDSSTEGERKKRERSRRVVPQLFNAIIEHLENLSDDGNDDD